MKRLVKLAAVIAAVLLALCCVGHSMKNLEICPTDKSDMQMIGHDKYGDIYICQECGYTIRIVE